MLKTQEFQFDGETFRIREPRLKDYLAARAAPADQYVFVMLSGMMIDENGDSVGLAFVEELPLRQMKPLTAIVDDLTRIDNDAPLTQSDGSSTG